MKNATAQPSPATRAALVALLKSDKAITATHRARILTAFDAIGERPKGWLPISAAARNVGVTLATAMNWANAGKIQSRRVGDRLTLVDQEEVAAYASTHKRRGPSSAH